MEHAVRGDRCGNEGTGGSMDEEVYPGTRRLVGSMGWNWRGAAM